MPLNALEELGYLEPGERSLIGRIVYDLLPLGLEDSLSVSLREQDHVADQLYDIAAQVLIHRPHPAVTPAVRDPDAEIKSISHGPCFAISSSLASRSENLKP